MSQRKECTECAEKCAGCNQGDVRSYQRTEMQKEHVLDLLRERGCRITKQRLILLDIILTEECSCCKEIYYLATLQDRSIGTATVYRMVNMLEEIGAISRKNLYRISCSEDQTKGFCTITLDDGEVIDIPAVSLNSIITKGLQVAGMINSEQSVQTVTAKGV